MEALITDERTLTIEQLQNQPHARILSFAEAIQFYVSPDSGSPLRIREGQEGLTDGVHNYPIVDNIPILYPASIVDAFLGGGLELKYYDNPRLQYFLLSQIKQRGEINAAASNVHYQRHLFRMKEFVKNCRGIVLDVGCDNVGISAALFHEECSYIGLDPFSSSKSNFRVVGVGEHLPFCDASMDNVIFNTSLDHMLDYHQALAEARRVLKPSGSIYLSTLIWTSNASLLNDSVHFHHFREYEILGTFGDMRVEQAVRYQYKNDQHRYGLFLQATKSSH